MECKRCSNRDPTYFYLGSKGYYCRKCVGFKRVLIDEDLNSLNYEINLSSDDYNLNYPLTSYQKEVSRETLKHLINKKDVLLHCVCGAGKTEIVVESIAYYLALGLKVAYGIARKEVVIELSERFKKIFTKANISSIYGGHHDNLKGDLIVCTTHQLFRYYQTFDLLILDEVDAFPLNNNETLMNISLNSCKGNVIFSTATVSTFINNYLSKRNYETVKLNIRPSLKPLIEPKVIYSINLINIIHLFLIMRKMTNQTIIFLSKKKLCYYFYLIFNKLFSCTYVYADLKNRNDNIINFKNKKYKFIFATSVLERGITIKDVNIIIYYDYDLAFSSSSIIQMCGRVGRNIANPYGKAYILSSCLSKEISSAVKQIKEANKAYELSILR